MGLNKCVGILLFLLALAPQARGEGQLLLIDRSGSMAKYYRSGLIKELGQRIDGLMRSQNIGPPSIGAFNDHVEVVSDIERVSASGSTYMDLAIDYAIINHPSLVWMITDNVQERQGEEAGKTKVFYDRLKEEVVKRVVIFPLKQEPGTPGIVVYAILLSSEAQEAFTKETEEFAHRTTNTVLLPMKPLDRDTIETVFVGDSNNGKGPQIYDDGADVMETMEVRFKSKFDHLRIVGADIINPRVAPEFSQTSLLNFERENVRITPTNITELGPGDETVQVYKVSVDLGKIAVKRDPVSLWKAALKNPVEEINLDLSFSIKVPKEKFQFTENFLNEYNAETLDGAKAEGKIYDLNELPLLVAENNTSIEVPH